MAEKCARCELELSDLDERFGPAPDGRYCHDTVRCIELLKLELEKLKLQDFDGRAIRD